MFSGHEGIAGAIRVVSGCNSQTASVIGATSGDLVASCGHLGDVLGPSRGHLGAILGPSWVHVGAILGPSGATLRARREGKRCGKTEKQIQQNAHGVEAKSPFSKFSGGALGGIFGT